ncbi:hypothetical protein ABT299_22385 [Spirillospora sp. NPDC000708]
MEIKPRLGALFAATTLFATGTIVASATAANAATFTYSCEVYNSATKAKIIRVYNGGKYAGYAMWNGDPSGSWPGDALRAYDGLADGWGVVANLSTGRTATTVGHNAPYYSPWATGDLTEGNHYDMYVQMKNGDLVASSGNCLVTA